MKKIIAKWYESENEMLGKKLIVIYSNHPRFITGSRFDFGFLHIASEEGYVIEIFPQ